MKEENVAKRRFKPRSRTIALVLGALAILLILLRREFDTSYLQSKFFSAASGAMTFEPRPGPSTSIAFPDSGPYDLRLGYSRLPDFIERLEENGFSIDTQVEMSGTLANAFRMGIFPPYDEKSQAGLKIFDRRGEIFYQTLRPNRIYDSFDSIPAEVVELLTFIEDRTLLRPENPRKNPAVDWNRFGKAIVEYAARHTGLRDGAVAGGSTLATQVVKYRHSEEGRTGSPVEKIRQMLSASLDAYRDGEVTMPARRRILLDYVNTVPMAGYAGLGEINGLGDALWAWFGADFDATNAVLQRGDPLSDTIDTHYARDYKRVLSLFLAHRRPSYYLVSGRAELESQTADYLRLLAKQGLISRALRDRALAVDVAFRTEQPSRERQSYLELKAANALRTPLLSLLGIRGLYELDGLDLEARSSLDAAVQRSITDVLGKLRHPREIRLAGASELRALHRGDPTRIIYSFTLYERGTDANWLRVETDNFDQPFNINQGVKLDLGSTAKLRTLVTYLEAVEALHARYSGKSSDRGSASVEVHDDAITLWALGYLNDSPHASLAAMLDAAMDRTYSASPAEIFFTGGGVHTFENFDEEDNVRVLSVREALYRSTNLVFVRLMRDIARYHMYRVPGAREALEESGDPSSRRVYLSRFADREGKVFLERYYEKYREKSPEQIENEILHARAANPRRTAIVYLSLEPGATAEELVRFFEEKVSGASISRKTLAHYHATLSPQALSLSDRAFLAKLHPLELWIAYYLRRNPGASWKDAVAASAAARQETYDWLFRTSDRAAQDARIRSLLEVEAFAEIHRAWRKLGYPFDSLVPSYATSIGSSADRPAALAELMGIIANEGVKLPMRRIESLTFGEATPFETVLSRRQPEGERVLSPEIAAVIREALYGVVEQGTARRLSGAVRLLDGTNIRIGGKTGTGDHRFETYGPGGRLLESRVVNRTATFVFLIGERYFGTAVAYVPGREAEDYRFTSSLPVQLVRVMLPSLSGLWTDSSFREPIRPRVKGAAGQRTDTAVVERVVGDTDIEPLEPFDPGIDTPATRGEVGETHPVGIPDTVTGLRLDTTAPRKQTEGGST